MPISQLEKPKSGDTVAIINTDFGAIKLKLFPNEAPKTVENFKTHAKNGYYDGLIFHRVINGFMIQAGDPTGTGRGGESIWGRPFEDEFSVDLHNLRGALSMANAGRNTNGSQFFIVQAKSVSEGLIKQMESLADRGFPAHAVESYKELGGAPWLDYKHSVFGQIYEGIDVVDNIAGVAVDANDKPVESVKILSIDIVTEA
ncbi:MAG: peptidylprolyl isomerase [Clostridiales bacterium]|nr:peptidylprolyl isomerase [Clostridiales bacterium]